MGLREISEWHKPRVHVEGTLEMTLIKILIHFVYSPVYSPLSV